MVFIKGYEKLQFDEVGNPYFLRTVSNDGTTEKVLPENATLPCLKELNLQVVLKREGYTPDMRKKVWYGLQQIQIKIPNEREFKNYFLVYDKKAMDTVCVKVLSPSIVDSFGNYNTYAYNMSLQPQKDSVEYGWVKFVGKPKQISPLKLKFMLQNKEIIAVLTDQGEQCI